MLCKHIEQLMKELDEIELSLDRTASLKLNGLFRLPYTYNTKAKKWSEGRWIHDDYPNVNQLYEILRVRELYEQKIPIVTISKELGISRPTIYKILDLPKTRQS